MTKGIVYNADSALFLLRCCSLSCFWTLVVKALRMQHQRPSAMSAGVAGENFAVLAVEAEDRGGWKCS
jgi:hypothetical protein